MRQLRERWGGCSHMLIERRLRNDPDFPKPVRLGGGEKGSGWRFFDEAEIESYERRKAVGAA
jgi:predicted DNA-binding transcriptional regulator AlpA